MKYTVEYHPKFIKDMRKLELSKNQKLNVIEKVDAVSSNPLPKTQGGYGELISRKTFGTLEV